ncbi:hypothetical protein C8035_v007598 [Colletotrichum spinosum]|uniref:Tautomerase cis-CaaD-like domain-containing protein n=1 Tax=Colletotrichum spinosum TaxID=1347390 RepID=A0A4R8Q027_9PEZI|nr:hypothetical protein C8035_v007598 [Colletotrichum spinosum]
MPFYQVDHICPLTVDERQSIATSITDLHCTAFDVPPSFIHVNFTKHENKADDGTYFLAAKSCANKSNCITAQVRTSNTRSKADWDRLAEDIETKWNEAVGIQGDKGEADDGSNESKELTMVVFTPIVTVREGGLAVPEPGKEAEWLEQQRLV